MKKGLLLLASVLMIPALAMAQVPEWDLDGPFWPAEFDEAGVGSGHGVAVDGNDNIWFQPFSATDSVSVPEDGGAFNATRVIYILAPDGSLIDRVKFVDLPGGGRDTLGGFWNAGAWEGKSGRGLRADADGNILVSQFDFLYYLDYTTVGDGDEVATALTAPTRLLDYCALSAPAVSETGSVFVGSVCNGDPASPQEVDGQDLTAQLSVVSDVSQGFSRSFEVTPDGNSVLWAGYTLHALVLYQRADEFSAWDSVTTVVRGMDSESITINGATGNLWVGSGSPNDLPNRYVLPDGTPVVTDWLSNTWYEFAMDDVLDGDDSVTPLATITWAECQTFDAVTGVCNETGGRPRGLAFSNDGLTAYTTQFSQTAPALYKYTAPGGTSIDQIDGTVPERYTLSQNYPNPFNPSTTIEFSLKEAAHARLSVYDMMGREVAMLVDRAMMPGTYEATFNASNLSSGVYMYRLEVGAEQLTGTMTLLK